MRTLDFAVLDFIQTYLRTPAGDKLMPVITMLGNAGFPWIVLGVVLLIRKEHRKTAVLLFVALGIEVLLCNVCLKNLVAAPRPFELNSAVEPLISRPLDYSFPSGHTGASFAAVCALWLGKERRWYLALIPAVLIAFSRMYLYVHFPTDIAGGILVGVISAFLAYRLVRFFSEYCGKKE